MNNKLPKIYLTAEEIYNMQDDELVGVSRCAINARLTELQIQHSEDNEVRNILHR